MIDIFDTGIGSAEENMRLDARLLHELDPRGKPILHLYRWSGPSLTFGHFIDPKKHLDLAQLEKSRIQSARRPTGGGIVFHIWDLAFSFLMPSGHPAFSSHTLANYRFVNQVVLDVMCAHFSLQTPELILEDVPSKSLDCKNFCMAKPTQYDVVHDGLKIAGAAQRRQKQGYLHQGTLSLALPQVELLEEVLLSKKEIVEAMLSYTFAPLGRIWEPKALEAARSEIQKRLGEKFMEKLSI